MSRVETFISMLWDGTLSPLGSVIAKGNSQASRCREKMKLPHQKSVNIVVNIEVFHQPG